MITDPFEDGLAVAVSNNDTETITYLLEFVDGNSRANLLAAIRTGNLATVQLMVTNGAALTDYSSAIEAAIIHQPILEYLCTKFDDFGRQIPQFIRDHPELALESIVALCELATNVEEAYEAALTTATIQANTTKILDLCERSANLEESYLRALYVAASYGRTSVLEMLNARGCSCERLTNECALVVACRNGDLGEVTRRFDRMQQTTFNRCVVEAATGGHREILRFLRAHPARSPRGA